MSELNVIGEREQTLDDLRWGTQNTKLAAALLVMGFALSSPQPFYVEIEKGKPNKTSIFFFPYIKQWGDGTKVAAGHLIAFKAAMIWMQESEDSEYPFIRWMRLGLEARDACIRDIYGVPANPAKIPSDAVSTDSLRDAACARGCGKKYFGHVGRKFYFEPSAQNVFAAANFPEHKGAARWMMKAMVQLNLLMDAVEKHSGPEGLATMHVVKGELGTARIPAALDQAGKNAFLREVKA